MSVSVVVDVAVCLVVVSGADVAAAEGSVSAVAGLSGAEVGK